MVESRTTHHHGSIVDTVAGFDVIECTACGFRHIDPIPTPEELERVYRHDYYSTEKPLYLERYREDLAWWNLVYSERYDTFEAELPAGRRRILDVGSGPGFFLLQGKERGWDTLGIEPSRQSAEHSRGLGLAIREEFLDESLAGELGLFDVVHLSLVLEHIPDPAAMIELARRLLAPGGLLLVVVPNDYNPFQEALREACDVSPWWVAPPHHVNYFDFDSLAVLLARCGFEVLRRDATFPIDMFLLMGDNYLGNDELGRACHARRMRFEMNLDKAGKGEVKRRLYGALAELGLGREVQILARRLP